MEEYKKYLIVGGMPEVVKDFINHHDYSNIKKIQSSIINAYIADMQKYADTSDTPKLVDIWNSIPQQLSKDNRKFQYSVIKKHGRSKEYQFPIHWLSMAGIVNRVEKVKVGRIPLISYKDDKSFKLYLLDVGLYGRLLNIPVEKILVDENILGTQKGPVAETYVLQSLVANQHQIFYWQPNQYTELDFVIQNKDGDVLGLEVKSGKGTSYNSLKKFQEEYDAIGIRISNKNFGKVENLITIPLYSVFCLGN